MSETDERARPDMVVRDPARVRALVESGLSAAPDPDMEVFAERVRARLRVPVALVSLVQPDQQVFPGMAGLPEPWASRRATPLSHSFCQHVVASARPLVVADSREHPLVRDNPAGPDLGVRAYAGMPLTTGDGLVLGSLGAIDTAPRQWSGAELDALADLALACSGELRLRLAQHEIAVERRHRDELDRALHRSFDRSQTLLAASQAFTRTTTVADVRTRVGELVATGLQPTYVGLVLLDERRRLRRTRDPQAPTGAEDRPPWDDYALSTVVPSATAVRENRLVHYADRDSFDADHPEPARTLLRRLGLHACVAVPLPGVDDADPVLGSVVLGWGAPRRVDPTDLLTITTIAGYAAQAVTRARRLAHRVGVAHRLQQAMLTTLPDVPGLDIAARYRPADAREDVGGDWYDVFPRPDPQRPDGQRITASVGDIIGHDLRAATLMGQVRSMLRQAAWDHPGRPASHVLSAFEEASAGLELGARGTAVLADLHRSPGRPWSLRWTNAGHPPPVLVDPAGAAELLDRHDILFGLTRASTRTDEVRTIPPGATLFLYTDGLIERRGEDIDAGIVRLVALLERLAGRAPEQIVDTAVDELGGADDDVVALAIRFR